MSLEALESYREHQADSIDFGYVTFGEERWLSVKVIADRDAPCIYLLIKRATAYQCLQKDISQMYVYDRCDYFIYLDTQANSYIMFGGSDNKTLPPVICDDYESTIVSYAETFVPPEDREMVIREMRLDRVCEMLELHGIHTLYTGVIDPERGYRRKKLEYRYYNKESKKVLLNRQAACAEIAAALQDMTLSALLFIDIDNFKSINDSFGHDVGDTVIIRIANILKAGIRQGQDIAGRIGGDEFIIFLRNLRSKEDALLCARRLCDRIFALNTGHHYTISSSIGIAFAPDDGTDYATLARAADQRVYRVKSSGKNGVNYTWNPDA
ncbi:GGDEF domain-containing protein [uncultured Desulfovibrio sp.]|uniref:GGDEF domain-containing protein n=1 Tax=uncultured Desulfovibrio sp. TaxID=167968 RepID=UPI0026365D46|nr:GGDEF domain-containing protein [uncultured Desulfovibrio sp.]